MNQNKLETMVLTKYFCLQSVLGKDPKARQTLFGDLTDIYRIPSERAGELFALTEREEITCIDSYDTYCIHSRALDYRNRFTAVPMQLPDDLLFVFRCKGKALKELSPLLGECKNDFSQRQLKFCLEKEELTYPIAVSFLFSYLFFTGSILPRDTVRGEKFAERCLRWNDINGILLLLRYGNAQKKSRYLSAFLTLITELDCVEDYSSAFTFYHTGESLHFSAETAAIVRYLSKNPEARETYDPAVAGFAASPLVTKDDRIRLLDAKGSNAAAFSEFFVGEKPDLFAAGRHLNACLSKDRKTECDQVEICMKKQSSAVVKTPVIITDDVAIKENYFNALKKIVTNEDYLMRFDIDSSVKAPFCQGKTNEVINLLVHNKVAGGLFFLCDVDKLSDDQAADLAKLLDAGHRRHFFLNDVGISLDLSDCSFVLTASEISIPAPLKKHCQIINVAEATKDEKKDYVGNLIRQYKSIYDCNYLVFSEDAEEYLCDCDSSEMRSLIERTCLTHNGEQQESTVTKSGLIQQFTDNRRMTFAIHNK